MVKLIKQNQRILGMSFSFSRKIPLVEGASDSFLEGSPWNCSTFDLLICQTMGQHSPETNGVYLLWHLFQENLKAWPQPQMKLKLTCYELNTWINCSCHGLTAAGVGDYLFWWCSCSSKLMIHVNIDFKKLGWD